MPLLADDALKWSILLEYGVPVQREVIAWADAQIAQADTQSSTLIDLATTSPDHTADILSHLHVLGAGRHFWAALRAAMPRLHEHLLAKPTDAEHVAANLYRTAVATPEVPADFKFAYRFDDAFSLAATGTYGNRDDVRRQFLDELAHFTSKA